MTVTLARPALVPTANIVYGTAEWTLWQLALTSGRRRITPAHQALAMRIANAYGDRYRVAVEVAVRQRKDGALVNDLEVAHPYGRQVARLDILLANWLCIEVDGASGRSAPHNKDGNIAHDNDRDAQLMLAGYVVLRRTINQLEAECNNAETLHLVGQFLAARPTLRSRRRGDRYDRATTVAV